MTRCPPGWMWVKTVGSGGKILEEGWEYRRPPDVLEGDGLAQIRPYVERLISSTNAVASLGIVTPDDPDAILLHQMEGRLQFTAVFLGKSREREQSARTLFAKQGCQVFADYLDLHGNRVLMWNLPKDAETVVELIQVYARKIEEIPPDAALHVTFEEHAEAGKFADESRLSFAMTYPIEDPTAPPPVLPADN